MVWADLVERRTRGTRAWLHLRDDEVVPRVLEAVEPRLVVWSSVWTARPDDRVELVLGRHGGGTELRVSVQCDDDGPDPATTSRIRYRTSVVLWNDLRVSYDA